MNRTSVFSLLVLSFSLLLFSSCNQKSVANTSDVPIKGVWFLKQENANPIFVRNKEEIGPRRFYNRLVLKEDGTFEWIEPGPTDIPKSIIGSWKWESPNTIKFISEEKEIIVAVILLDSSTLTLNRLPR